ncbi:MAG: nucleotide exchange factor GrpE, partial [Planctomycetes bacterium]|nr:nucleotide exchange factor GrpE [Planctomycetota bacterium]
MSKEKKKDELHEEVEVVDEKVSGSEDEQDVAEDGSEVVEESPDLEKELADAVQQAADLRDQMLRAAAENENFKKRIERERSASLKYAGEQIFREMLPAVDNLERAIGQGVVDGVDAEKNLAALIE